MSLVLGLEISPHGAGYRRRHSAAWTVDGCARSACDPRARRLARQTGLPNSIGQVQACIAKLVFDDSKLFLFGNVHSPLNHLADSLLHLGSHLLHEFFNPLFARRFDRSVPVCASHRGPTWCKSHGANPISPLTYASPLGFPPKYQPLTHCVEPA